MKEKKKRKIRKERIRKDQKPKKMRTQLDRRLL
jgi:hypothetical protein